ncbi:MAG: hypothetical protein R3C05_02755 [Pirellulaceae bacterium]
MAQLRQAGQPNDASCQSHADGDLAGMGAAGQFACCSPVVAGGRIYIAGPKLVCLNGVTGDEVWSGAGFNYGASLIMTSDQRLIVLGNRGKLRLVETDRNRGETYRELAELQVLGRDDIWSHVVFANDKLYCKDVRGRLVCLKRSDST